MVAGKSSTMTSGRRNNMYLATTPAPALVTAMNRHSSNNVKMLKIAASATKHTRKLSASERKSVASIRLGKPNAEKPRCFVLASFVAGADPFDTLDSDTEDKNGTRVTNRNSKLKARMKTVAIHGPT